MHSLVAACPPLDTNSRYCNLLQATHFADTCILAEQEGELLGLVSGYRLPQRAQTLFVWQVAVSPQARGRGLALSMLESLLGRLPEIEFIETTVTPDNTASARLFKRLAEKRAAELKKSVLFERDRHFEGHHDDEVLLRIGPFAPE